MTKELKEEVAKIVDNPKREEGMLFLIFNHPRFETLCASLLPSYTREMVFAELLKDPPSAFRLQFAQNFGEAASHLNDTLVCFRVSNILSNCECLIFILSREWYQS